MSRLNLWPVIGAMLAVFFLCGYTFPFSDATPPPPPASPPLLPPDQAPASGSSAWRIYLGISSTRALVAAGDAIWAATDGGVLRWDRENNTYVQYTTADGLVSNNATALAIDQMGYLWVGTLNGVSKFDGQSWTTYTQADGLVHNRVYTIAIAPTEAKSTGQIWFGTEAGVSIFDGQSWMTYTTANGLANNYVRAIAIDRAGHAWFGSMGGGVSRFDGQTWTTYTTADGLVYDYVQAIAVDPTGSIWFGTTDGLSQFDGQSWTSYDFELQIPSIPTLAVDPGGRVWAGFGDWSSRYNNVANGAGLIDRANSWTIFTKEQGLPDNNVTAITVDAEGAVWLGSPVGLTRLEDSSGETWITHPYPGPAGRQVQAIAIEQRETTSMGRVWVGYHDQKRGVEVFDGQNWTTYTLVDGLASDSLNAIAVDDRGHIWVGGPRSVLGTGAGGVSEFDGRIWRSYTPADGLISDQVRAIAVDRAGRKWFATAEEDGLGGGASMFDGVNWTSYTADDGLAGNKVLSLAIDPSDRKWFGTTAGVSRFDGQSWTTYTTADGLAHNQVNAVAIDSAGRLWFGTAGGGVSLFDGQSWTSYTAADGLASNVIYTLAVDQAGHLWAGTSGGLSEFDGARWRSYTRRDGLPFGQVRALAIDSAGHKWLGFGQSSAGIVEFDERRWTASPPTLPVLVVTPAANPPVAAVEITGPRFTDEQAGRSYARGSVDGVEKTLVLASADERLLVTYNLVGELALDSPHHRLYIDQGSAGLAVVNTRTERLDNLIYLPEPAPSTPIAAPQIDPTSGQVLAFRDNVVYILDAETGAIVRTLTSGFSQAMTCWGGPVLGIPAISKTTYDPANRILYLAAQTFSCNSSLGGNSGFSMESYQFPSGAKIAEGGGGYSGVGTVLGRYFYLGDVSTPAGWHNGIRSVWRDGRPWASSGGWAEVGETLGFDAKRGRFYEVTAHSLRVFDAETMTLRLHLPRPLAGDFAGYDAAADQLLFRDNGRVQTWPASAIQTPAPEPLTNKPLPETAVTFLAVSPNWVEDQTLFGLWSDPNPLYECNSPSLNEGSFFLSADGGQTWGQSWGGLRGSCELLTTLAVSPDYARDQTLFAGVAGLGLFKSSDGGRLWQPASAGLDYMGISQILLSPGFPADQTLFALAGAWYRSTDEGQTWQPLSEVLSGRPGCPGAMALSPEFAIDRTVACTAFNQSSEQTELYLSRDGGDRWELIGPTPAGIYVQMVNLAPLFAKWQTLFIYGTDSTDMTKIALYRSTDSGRTWMQVLAPELSSDASTSGGVTPSLVYVSGSELNRPIFLLIGEMIYQSNDGGQTWQRFDLSAGVIPTALAISPHFAQDRTLFIGTANGQVLTLEVTQ